MKLNKTKIQGWEVYDEASKLYIKAMIQKYGFESISDAITFIEDEEKASAENKSKAKAPKQSNAKLAK